MIPLDIRWLIRRDVPEIIAIDRMSFTNPVSAEDIAAQMRATSMIWLVAVHDDRIVGYIAYSLLKHQFAVDRLAVAPAFRRRGVASALVRKITRKMNDGLRSKVHVQVSERDLEAQLFFRSAGFRYGATICECDSGAEREYYLLQCCRERPDRFRAEDVQWARQCF